MNHYYEVLRTLLAIKHYMCYDYYYHHVVGVAITKPYRIQNILPDIETACTNLPSGYIPSTVVIFQRTGE